MSRPDPVSALEGLGLTGLEAAIYVHLLTESPVTGYAVAKGLHKPAANVYRALDTLAAKGAVEIEDGDKRFVRPVPYKELLQNIGRHFNQLRKEADDALSELPGPGCDHRIYHLHTQEQVLAKCLAMLGGARSVVLADLFPESAELLRPELERIIESGVNVVIRTYKPFVLEGAVVEQAPDGEAILARWPAQWLNLVVDGQQSLVSVFGSRKGEIIQAFWTSSPALSYLHHSGLISEVGFASLQNDVNAARSLAEMKQSMERLAGYMAPSTPGFLRLTSTLGLSGLGENSDQVS